MRCMSVLLALTVVVADSALTAILHIPDDYETMADAVAAASEGDTIVVADGTYSGPGFHNVDMQNVGLRILSENGASATVIDLEGQNRAFKNCNAAFDGFTFRSGNAPIGGVLHAASSGGLDIRNCRFENSVADRGGAISISGGIPLHIEGSVFTGNAASLAGSAVDCYLLSATISDCEFLDHDGNSVVRLDEISGSISDCRFADNEGKGCHTSSHGNLGILRCDFIRNAGAFHTDHDDDIVFEDCVFIGNESDRGGAGLINQSRVTLIGCVMASNVATVAGGALHCDEEWLTLQNCTIANNDSPRGAVYFRYPGFYDVIIENTIVAFNGTGPGFGHYDFGFPNMVLTCCDIYGNTGGDWVEDLAGQLGVEGNISADPIFCDPVNHNYFLHVDSPCLPGNHPAGYDCGLIGALGEGCGATPTRMATWGQLKGHYRE